MIEDRLGDDGCGGKFQRRKGSRVEDFEEIRRGLYSTILEHLQGKGGVCGATLWFIKNPDSSGTHREGTKCETHGVWKPNVASPKKGVKEVLLQMFRQEKVR